MWCHHVLIISTVIPFLKSQLYFPDENTGGYMQMGEALAGTAGPPITNLTGLRGTTIYEQYVDRIIASGILKLTLDVQRALIMTGTSTTESSVVYSPVNIAGALALVLLGSNGKTFEEIAGIMGLATGINIQNKSQLVHEQFGRLMEKLQSASDTDRQVNFATAIFVQTNYPIREIYRQTAETVYESEVLNVDFKSNPSAAQNTINAWVSERTKGKINDILSETPSEGTKVILASAMYFKAEWEKPFFDGTTKRRPFYTNGRNSKSNIMVEMMSNGGLFPYYKDQTLNCEIVGFPYVRNQTTMYVVIPHNSNKQRLKDLEQTLTPAEIQRLVANVKYTGAIILFPKMRIDCTIDLKKTLKMLGLKSLFDSTQSNLALLSPGVGNPVRNPVIGESLQNPISVGTTGNDVIIFSRTGVPVNCTQIFNPMVNVNTCEDVFNATNNAQHIITYKKFGSKVGRRLDRKVTPQISESLDNIRQYLNQPKNNENVENPGLYADTVIHKVYMDITESGTEAAAATSISLSRDGGRVTVRVDVPFFFFIMHEETKTALFWGSVNSPTPHFN